MIDERHDMLRIIELIREVSLGSRNTQIDEDTDLILGGVLDSIDVLDLSTRLQQCFAVELANRDINPRNFRNVKQIRALIVGSRGR